MKKILAGCLRGLEKGEEGEGRESPPTAGFSSRPPVPQASKKIHRLLLVIQDSKCRIRTAWYGITIETNVSLTVVRILGVEAFHYRLSLGSGCGTV